MLILTMCKKTLRLEQSTMTPLTQQKLPSSRFSVRLPAFSDVIFGTITRGSPTLKTVLPATTPMFSLSIQKRESISYPAEIFLRIDEIRVV